MDVITLALAKKYADEKLTNIDSLSTQSDWNQNDETALDYIKNKPFGVEGMEDFAIGENVQHKSKLMPGTFFSEISHTFDPNLQYKIIINEDEYICTPQMNDKGNWYLGSTRNTLDLFPNILDMDPSKYNWDNEEYPFSYGSGGFVIKPPYQDTYTISLYQIREKIKTLDAKYINYIPGQKTAFKTVIYDDTEYVCEEGAEIFNDYLNNLAIGQYSHAEGSKTTATGDYSHVEGRKTIADGMSAHAEGDTTKASGHYSHAEGMDTEASGTGSHAEGVGTKANASSSHTEGEHTIALGQSQHVQGKYNIEDTPPKYIPTYASYLTPEAVPEVDGDEVVYLIKEEDITFDGENNYYIIKDFTETPYKDLKEGDNYLTTEPTSNNVSLIYHIRNLVSTRVDESTGKTYYKWMYGLKVSSPNRLGLNCKYAHIVGNGTSEENRSNAHTLDWDGNAWYQGDVYVGSNSGINKDEGSKKLATENFVNEKFNQLSQEKASKATTLAGYGITDGVTNKQIEQFSGTVEITGGAPTKEKTVLTIDPSAEEINVYSAEEIDVKFEEVHEEIGEISQEIDDQQRAINALTGNDIDIEYYMTVKNHYVTPEMFGAVGDNVADDTEALKQCLLQDKPVYLSGNYKITEDLYITKQNFVMFGKVGGYSATSPTLYFENGSLRINSGIFNTRLKSFAIRSNTIGLLLDGEERMGNFLFDDLQFICKKCVKLDVESGYIWFINCKFTSDSTTDDCLIDLRYTGTTANRLNYVYFDRCAIEGGAIPNNIGSGKLFVIGNCSNINITNCDLCNASYAVYVDVTHGNPQYIKMTNNYIWTITTALNMTGINSSLFANNNVSNRSGQPILVSNVFRNNAIVGNTFAYWTTPTTGKVVGNIFKGNVISLKSASLEQIACREDLINIEKTYPITLAAGQSITKTLDMKVCYVDTLYITCSDNDITYTSTIDGTNFVITLTNPTTEDKEFLMFVH